MNNSTRLHLRPVAKSPIFPRTRQCSSRRTANILSCSNGNYLHGVDRHSTNSKRSPTAKQDTHHSCKPLLFAHPTTRALIRVVGESSSTSIGNSVLTSSSESRALIGSSTGLAERETSNCGTVNLSLLACGSETGDIPPSTRESRLRGSFCRKPSSLPTLSMLLKYY
jgi:hypothetical protein